jgi:hypothetical protein
MKLYAFAAATAIGLTLSAGAQAATLFDQNLASPGWFDGSGNPNGGFTVNTGNGITIAQRVKLRQDPNVIHSSNGVYDVPTGPQTSPVDSSPPHAAWNYEFDIGCNLGTCPGGSLLALLGTSTMTVTDITTGHSNIVSMLTWTDDAAWNGSAKTTIFAPAAYIAQNSENPIFGDFPLAAFYNENSPDIYRFTLNIKDVTGDVLDTNTVWANASGFSFMPGVPEPATWAMMFLGFGAIGGMMRAKRKRETLAA